MATYSIKAPNGKTYSIDGPEGASKEDVIWALTQKMPGENFEKIPEPRSRTVGEFVSDIGASAKKGLGALAQFPGQIGALAGIASPDNAFIKYGEQLQAEAEAAKSDPLKQRQLAAQQQMQAVEGQGIGAEALTAIKAYGGDPALLTSFLAEQVPQLILPAGVGKGAQLGAKALMGATAPALGKIGVGAAVGTGATMQGASVGMEQFERAYKTLVEQGVPEDQAKDQALTLARASGAGAAVLSLLIQKLPGASAFEKSLLGGEKITGGLLGRTATGALKEGVTEGIEEGGGQLAANIAQRTIAPEQSLSAGVGTAVGLGALGGAGVGGIASAVTGAPETPANRGTPEVAATPDEQRRMAFQRRQEIAAQEAETKKQEQAKEAELRAVQRDIRANIKVWDEYQLEQAKAQEKQLQGELARQREANAEARKQRMDDLRAAFPADYSNVESIFQLEEEKRAIEATPTPDAKRLKKINDRLNILYAPLRQAEAEQVAAGQPTQIEDPKARAAKRLEELKQAFPASYENVYNVGLLERELAFLEAQPKKDQRRIANVRNQLGVLYREDPTLAAIIEQDRLAKGLSQIPPWVTLSRKSAADSAKVLTSAEPQQMELNLGEEPGRVQGPTPEQDEDNRPLPVLDTEYLQSIGVAKKAGIAAKAIRPDPARGITEYMGGLGDLDLNDPNDFARATQLIQGKVIGNDLIRPNTKAALQTLLTQNPALAQQSLNLLGMEPNPGRKYQKKVRPPKETGPTPLDKFYEQVRQSTRAEDDFDTPLTLPDLVAQIDRMGLTTPNLANSWFGAKNYAGTKLGDIIGKTPRQLMEEGVSVRSGALAKALDALMPPDTAPQRMAEGERKQAEAEAEDIASRLKPDIDAATESVLMEKIGVAQDALADAQSEGNLGGEAMWRKLLDNYRARLAELRGGKDAATTTTPAAEPAGSAGPETGDSTSEQAPGKLPDGRRAVGDVSSDGNRRGAGVAEGSDGARGGVGSGGANVGESAKTGQTGAQTLSAQEFWDEDAQDRRDENAKRGQNIYEPMWANLSPQEQQLFETSGVTLASIDLVRAKHRARLIAEGKTPQSLVAQPEAPKKRVRRTRDQIVADQQKQREAKAAEEKRKADEAAARIEAAKKAKAEEQAKLEREKTEAEKAKEERKKQNQLATEKERKRKAEEYWNKATGKQPSKAFNTLSEKSKQRWYDLYNSKNRTYETVDTVLREDLEARLEDAVTRDFRERGEARSKLVEGGKFNPSEVMFAMQNADVRGMGAIEDDNLKNALIAAGLATSTKLTQKGSDFLWNQLSKQDSTVSAQRLVDVVLGEYAAVDTKAAEEAKPTYPQKAIEDFFKPELLKNTAPDYKFREKIVYMNIDDFLAMSSYMAREESQRARESAQQGIKWESLPRINMDETNAGKVRRVVGHEGRHRALVMKEAGFDVMPVVLVDPAIRWDQQNDPENFDYVQDWPVYLQAQAKAKNPNAKIRFPVPNRIIADRKAYMPDQLERMFGTDPEFDPIAFAIQSAETAFDQVGEYKDLNEAIDSQGINLGDTMADKGIKDDSIRQLAFEKFDARVKELRDAQEAKAKAEEAAKKKRAEAVELPVKEVETTKPSAWDRNLPSREKYESANAGDKYAPSYDEAVTVQKTVHGKSMVEAAQWLAENASNKSHRVIAKKVINSLRALELAGAELLPINVAHVGDETINTESRGFSAWRLEEGKTARWRIELKGADVNGRVGVSEEIVLHELLHVVTQGAIYVAERPSNRAAAPNVDKLVLDLFDLREHVVKLYNKALKDGTPLPEGMQALINETNAFKDTDEFLAWGLTNPKMQKLLESIPYKSGSAWTKFVTAIREFLGVPAQTESVLSELLKVSEGLLDVPVSEYMDVLEGKYGAKIIRGKSESVAQGNMTAFKRWFGNSKIVNRDGTPKIMYHGTARDISAFRAKQANAIFVTDDPRFAEGFADMSADYMIGEYLLGLSSDERAKLEAKAEKIAKKNKTDKANELRALAKEMLKSGKNIMPLYVRAENPFDYQNPEHVAALRRWDIQNRYREIAGQDRPMINEAQVEAGSWTAIESRRAQTAIREMGFDGFYVREGGRKNLAVYSSTQLKSATGNIGTYGEVENISEQLADGPKTLYHRSSMPALKSIEPGESFTLKPGSQGAEGIGVYFSEGVPVRQTTAEGTRGGQTAVVVVEGVRPSGWWRSKGAKTTKFGKPRTWHTDKKSLELRATKTYEQDGQRYIISEPVSSWVSIATDNIGAYGGAERISEQISDPVAEVEAITGRPARMVQQKPRPTAIDRLKDIADNAKNLGPTEFAAQAIRNVPSRLTAFRTLAVDNLATVERRLMDAYSKGFRDSFGSINPVAFARQAMDAPRLAADFFKAGKIVLDKDGMVRTKKSGPNFEDVLKQLKAYAEKNGRTYEEVEGAFNEMLEAKRVVDLYRENERREKDINDLLAQGKKEQARKLSEKRPQLKIHMSQATAEELAEAFDNTPEFVKLRDQLNEIRVGVLELSRDAGVIDQETFEDWAANGDYVPFDRLVDWERGEYDAYSKKAIARGLAAFPKTKQFRGSYERPVNNIMDNYARTMEWMISRAVRNHASNALLNDMTALNFAIPLKDPKQSTMKNLVVHTFVDGKDAYHEVASEYDYMAFGAYPLASGPLVQMLAKTTRVLRSSITLLPPFAINQVIQDAQRAAIMSGTAHPLKVIGKTLMRFPQIAVYEYSGKFKPKAYDELARAGVVGDFDFNAEKAAQEVRYNTGIQKREPWARFINLAEKFTKASDLAARMAVYEQIKTEFGDSARAEYAARELINFKRRGASAIISNLIPTVPFFNAYAQGMDVMYRQFFMPGATASGAERSAARAAMVRTSMMIIGLSLAYAVMMHDEPEYMKAENYVRDRNFLLPGGFKIPVPNEFGVVLKSSAEAAVNYYMTSGTDKERTALGAIKEYFTQFGAAVASPNVISPWPRVALEQFTNFDFFTGRDIDPERGSQKEPALRYGPNTSELAKSIGELTGVSPYRIDHVMRGILGTTYSTATLLVDGMLNPSLPDRPVHKLPFMDILMFRPEGSRTKSLTYELLKEAETAHATFEALLKDNPNAAAKYLEEKGDVMGMRDYLKFTVDQLAFMRSHKNTIINAKNEDIGMDGAQKREALTEIEAVENELTKEIAAIRKAMKLN